MGNMCTKFESADIKINTITDAKFANASEMTNSNLYTVGWNNRGQLGLEHQENVTELKQAPNDINISTVYCGNSFTVLLTTEGIYYAVGNNEYGQCSVNRNDKNIIPQTAINYFNATQSKVQKVFANCNGQSIFWLTNDDKIYANGRNEEYQLGLKHNKSRIKPEIVLGLNGYRIKDIQNGRSHSIALAQNGSVFGAGDKGYLGLNNALYINEEKKINEYKRGEWNEIRSLTNINIAQTQCGWMYSLFLSFEGVVYSGGRNQYGQLGRGKDCSVTIEPIKHFTDESIVIKSVKCGYYHNLALDDKGNVYACGYNWYGQLGIGTKTVRVYVPKQLNTEAFGKITEIICGRYHSCVQNETGQYWMFGSDSVNQVTLFTEAEDTDEDKEELSAEKRTSNSPYFINDAFTEITKGRDIKDVFLGSQCTFIITEYKEINSIQSNDDI